MDIKESIKDGLKSLAIESDNDETLLELVDCYLSFYSEGAVTLAEVVFGDISCLQKLNKAVNDCEGSPIWRDITEIVKNAANDIIICAILDDTSSVIDDELKKWAQIADACDDILYDRYTKLHKDIKEV